jgi:phosphoglycerate dehydrogenase-like enzyme
VTQSTAEPVVVVIGIELEPAEVLRIRDSFPDANVVYAPSDEELRRTIPTADVLFGGRSVADLLPLAPRLRWIQTYSAGIDRLPLDDLARRSILLTNASGAHGAQIAENILALMLAFAVRIPALVRAQTNHAWIARTVDREKFVLEGQTLLIAGLGGIGGSLARKAAALGLSVLGVRGRDLPPPAGVSEIVRPADLHAALGRADHVALCLPLTPETTGFLGEAELRAMKPTAYVYNVGRGESIERESLLRALREGWIGGAGLDVTDPEPLPSDDPLWDLQNIILTQHTSGAAPDLDRRVTDIFAGNLRRFLKNEPLNNVVDYGRRY